MSDYLILAGFYGGLLLIIYWRVRRHAHPSRSMFLSFLGTVAFMLLVLFLAIFLGMAAFVLAGGNLMHVRPEEKVWVNIGAACIFGAVLGAWYFARDRIRQPRRSAF